MRTFARTSLGRIIVILATWIYMTNFQQEVLYNFLNINNNDNDIITIIDEKIESLSSGQNISFEEMNKKLDNVITYLTENETTTNTTQDTDEGENENDNNTDTTVDLNL